MATTSNHVSALAAALAPGYILRKPRDAGHPGTIHSLLSSSNTHPGEGGLPTPPNSLSPTLPPQKASPSAVAHTPLESIESDMELQDAPVRAEASGSPEDATGDITPALLGKHHLPAIMLHNGTMAIRYILGGLTSSVPGFARIEPAKARRITVAALESKAGGGLKGEVVFDKISWGRWSARYRTEPAPEAREDSAELASPTLPPSRSYPNRISRSRGHHRRRRVSPLSPSYAHDHISEDEADKMSLDGKDNEPVSPRIVRKIPIIQAPDDSDVTDEEDWESIGPEGLRAMSYVPSYAASWASRRGSHSSSINNGQRPRLSTSAARPSPIPMARGGISKRKSSSHMPLVSPAVSPDVLRSMTYSGGILPFQRVYSSSLSSAIRMHGVRGAGGSPQEAEAVEALIRMGSM